MTVCTDVYVRPQTCDTIRIYPSQVHPPSPPGPGGGPGGGMPHFINISSETGPARRRPDDDEDVALLIALGYLQ